MQGLQSAAGRDLNGGMGAFFVFGKLAGCFLRSELVVPEQNVSFCMIIEYDLFKRYVSSRQICQSLYDKRTSRVFRFS